MPKFGETPPTPEGELEEERKGVSPEASEALDGMKEALDKLGRAIEGEMTPEESEKAEEIAKGILEMAGKGKSPREKLFEGGKTLKEKLVEETKEVKE